MLTQIDGGKHPREAAADDQRRGLLDHRLPGEPRLDERITIELLVELVELGHPIGADPLLLLLAIPLTKLLDRKLFAAVLLLHRCRPPHLESSAAP